MHDAPRQAASEHLRSNVEVLPGGAAPRERKFEIAASVLMSIAVVATAFCAWQATRWDGVQALRYAEASALNVKSDKAANAANVQMSYDANTFVELALAYQGGNQVGARSIAQRFIRDEFRRYVDEWLRLEATQGNAAPDSPFELKNYRNARMEESNKLEAQAARKFAQGREADQTGADYILATVFFATALFFAGISSKFEALPVRTAILVMAGFGLAVGLTRALTLPFY